MHVTMNIKFTRNILPTGRGETQDPINIQTIPACKYTGTIHTRQAYQNTHVPFFFIEAHDFVLVTSTIYDGHNMFLQSTCKPLPNSAPFLYTWS